MDRPRIIGIGNPSRCDDGVGPWLAGQLAGRLGPQAQVLTLGNDGLSLLDAFRGAQEVLLLDAVQSGAPAGTVHRLDAAAAPLPPDWLRCSTHLLGASEAVELARALGDLPEKLTVYGIEGADFGLGEGLSTPVAVAAAALVEEIIRQYTQASHA
ncbi:hydrogenase maturation protease [Immundisolibacter sp.]|uniref:hydrogenase maturation protease n=1 Tax=Immundisolibacter sp. TaxID=1934948 RepID=UPI00356AF794